MFKADEIGEEERERGRQGERQLKT